MSQDTVLHFEVIAELDWEPSVTGAHIGVAANAGVMTAMAMFTTGVAIQR